jgi:hypothetical protein
MIGNLMRLEHSIVGYNKNMRHTAPWSLVIILAGVIGLLLWMLYQSYMPSATAHPVSKAQQSKSSLAPEKTVSPIAPDAPLSSVVVVTSPLPHATVDVSFVVEGRAPVGWFSESVFPIQVRDENNNVIARATAHGPTAWKKSTALSWSATVTVLGPYTGPATLILLRNNPSGLPENDDAVTIPIVIQ